VALAGNPNSGKTSIFNRLTGSNQHVANFPGVTVERKEGRAAFGGRRAVVVDLPGTYSLTAYSIEEIVARNFLVDERPGLVVDVLDASNLQRNLYLATQLLELELPLVLAANMLDVAGRRGRRVDLDELGRRLGVPVVGLEGHRGRGVDRLRAAVAARLADPVPPRPAVVFDAPVEQAVARLAARLAADARPGAGGPPPRWTALRLLEGDRRIVERLPELVADPSALRAAAEAESAAIELAASVACEVHLASLRHEAIRALLEGCRAPEAPGRVFRSDRVDAVLLNRWLGLPIFLGLMYLTFQATFTLGEAPMGWIEAGFAWLAGAIDAVWPGGGALKSLVLDGAIGGVGGVLVFLPNIVLLFLCLTLMEDSGYMARAAFLMDRLMHRIGLHGKSFIPLLTGFGCSIPGIMGTRVLENERDRLLTMLVLPLMSCGARLPIYLLIIPAFFPERLHAEMLFLIYAVGVGLAVGLAKLLRISVLKGEATPFVMELPPYKLPTPGSLWQTIKLRCWLYLRKAGTLILGVSLLLWALASWPPPPAAPASSAPAAAAALAAPAAAGAARAENLAAEARMEHSLLGRLGRAIEPAMAPLGFDWRISTAMIGAFAAKEVFVAQLGVVFALGETDEGSATLREALRARYTPLIGFCVMLFSLVATPCMSTFAVTRRESGRLKWAFFQLGGLTALAWLLTAAVYQLGTLAGL